MKRSTIDRLCQLLEPHLKERRSPHGVIPKKTRIAIGLYRLSSSAELRTTSKKYFGAGNATVCVAFYEFIDATSAALRVIISFRRAHELGEISMGFERIGGFPGIIAAVDGMYTPISSPQRRQVDYVNVHGWHSINSLALVDSKYIFRFFRTGYPGRVHDARMFRDSSIANAINRGNLRGRLVLADHL